jgi:hypothetical protein
MEAGRGGSRAEAKPGCEATGGSEAQCRERTGDVAQLVERLLCKQEVRGSSPLISKSAEASPRTFPRSCPRISENQTNSAASGILTLVGPRDYSADRCPCLVVGATPRSRRCNGPHQGCCCNRWRASRWRSTIDIFCDRQQWERYIVHICGRACVRARIAYISRGIRLRLCHRHVGRFWPRAAEHSRARRGGDLGSLPFSSATGFCMDGAPCPSLIAASRVVALGYERFFICTWRSQLQSAFTCSINPRRP